MKSSEEIYRNINEYLIEIRIKPSSKIFDKRGSIVEDLSKKYKLDHWIIGQNRVEIYDIQLKDPSKLNEVEKRIFVGFRNFGIQRKLMTTWQNINVEIKTLVDYIYKNDVYVKSLEIERIGVRSKFIEESILKFDELYAIINEKIFRLNTNSTSIFDGKVKDIGLNLDLENGGKFISLRTGPMERKQMGKYIAGEIKFPQVGTYLELDHYELPNEVLSAAKLREKIKFLIRRNWEMHKELQKVIFE